MIETEHTVYVGQLYLILDEKRDAMAAAQRSRLNERAKCERLDAIDDQIAALRYALRALGEDI